MYDVQLLLNLFIVKEGKYSYFIQYKMMIMYYFF